MPSPSDAKPEQYRFSVGLRSVMEAQTLATAGPAVFDSSELAEAQFIAGRQVLRNDPHAERHLREKRIAESLIIAAAEGTAWSTSDLETQLPRTYVTALRMGPVRAVSDDDISPRDSEAACWDDFGVTFTPSGLAATGGEPAGPTRYVRTRIGMSLADSAAEVWSSARGYWRMSADTEYLVPTRFGYAPYVFKIDEWADSEPRIWATRGSLIDVRSGRLLPMLESSGVDDRWLPRVADAGEDATADDLNVARLISGRVVGLGKRGPNPVQRLRSRTRRITGRFPD